MSGILLWYRSEKRRSEAASLGLFPLPLKSSNGRKALRLELHPAPTCLPGDLDALLDAGPSAKAARLLITLEPWSPGDGALVASTETDSSSLADGESVDLKIASVPHRSALGLFICTDTARTQRCAGKDFFGARTLAHGFPAAPPGSGKSRVRRADEIIAVHWVLADAGDLFVARILPWGEGFRSWVATALGATPGSPRRRQTESSLQRAADTISFLRPIPLDLAPDHATIFLTKGDPSACPGFQPPGRP